MIEPGEVMELPAGMRVRFVPIETPLFVPLLDNGNGQVMASFMMDHTAAFAGRQVHMVRASDSHANRGMNKIANAFLESGCDIWINIDADIRFRKQDIDNLLSHDLPLVYGIYPKKEESTPPCLGTFDTIPIPDPLTGLAVVRRCGRGFMLVHRQLLEAMKEDNGGPALRYHNHDKVEWDFFPSGVVEGAFSAFGHTYDEMGHYPKREWISEDWYFCEVARSIGVKTFVDTRIALGHVGQKEYRFSTDQVTRMDSNITTWRDIHGWFDYEDLYRQLARALVSGRDGSPGGPTIFVEVGSWLGRSIAAMAEFIRDLSPRPMPLGPLGQAAGLQIAPVVELHAVDTFAGTPANESQRAILEAHGGSTEKAFRANMAALGIDVTVHAKPSIEAAADFADRSIDAVFIDGDHRYEHVKADIAAWWPKIKICGVLCGHDFDEAGVGAAVRNMFFAHAIETIGRCWKVTRTS